MSPALQCENGLVYEACGPACSPACPGSPSVSESLCSALSCVEGCFCPHGTVRHGKRSVFMSVCGYLVCSSYVFVCLSSAGDACIPPSQCPCEWDGSLFPAGATVTQHCQNWSVYQGSSNLSLDRSAAEFSS